MKKELTENQRKLDTDLWIIFLTSLAVFLLFIFFQKELYGIVQDKKIPILVRVSVMALFQFGLAGLGIMVVKFLRRESFRNYGLKTEGILLSIVLCALCFLPYILFLFAKDGVISYLPFQSVLTTKEVLGSGLPHSIIGMVVTAISWGFFEGFNYVVVSQKINERYPSRNKWLNWGAIVCAIMCILIHGAIGVTLDGFIEMISIIIIIYGMIMVKEFTGNAWGCVFIFLFLWNAF